MIDNFLISLLESTGRGDCPLETVANTLEESTYLDIMAWYGKYSETSSSPNYLGCAELLLFLHKNGDINFMRVEAFDSVFSILNQKFKIKKETFFAFLCDYQKLLYGTIPG